MFASLMTLSCLKPSYDTLLLVLTNFTIRPTISFFMSMLHMDCPGIFHLDWCILSWLRITIGAFFALDIIAYMSLYSVSMLDAYITHLTYCVT